MKHINLTIIFFLLQMGSVASAMTPGSSKAHWKPEAINQLTPHEVRSLKSANCLITSYRDMDVGYTENSSSEPDKQDALMLVRGEFASKGQKDLLAFCKSANSEAEFLIVVWGGSVQCPNIILMNEVSKFWKKRDPSLDYYGSRLNVFHPSETLSFLDRIRNSEISPEEMKWVLKKDSFPKLEHDSIAFFGNYSFMFYCNGYDWVKLYDFYSTYID